MILSLIRILMMRDNSEQCDDRLPILFQGFVFHIQAL